MEFEGGSDGGDAKDGGEVSFSDFKLKVAVEVISEGWWWRWRIGGYDACREVRFVAVVVYWGRVSWCVAAGACCGDVCGVVRGILGWWFSLCMGFGSRGLGKGEMCVKKEEEESGDKEGRGSFAYTGRFNRKGSRE